MSLNNITLAPSLIEGLFKKTLVELKTNSAVKLPNPAATFQILGKNKKGVIILVDNNATAFLPEAELNFLITILSACKLTLEDVGILNMAKSTQLKYQQFEKEIIANKIILLGVAPTAIDLPLSFPYYQIQAYNHVTYLAAPSLMVLLEQKTEKIKLWNCLKLIFDI